MNIKCIAIDDEHMALEKIKSFVEKLPQLHMLATFSNSNDALEFISNNDVQLIFLDIQMDHMSGIEMLEKIITRPQIIFITAFIEYAPKAFDLAVTDFLLKPYTFDRFKLAVNKASEYMQWQQRKFTEIQKPADYIFVKSGYKLIKISVNDILYIEGMRDYQYIVTSTEKVIASHSIQELDKMLPNSLIRCHKSYIVALSGITSIERDRIRIGNKYIPIGDAYKDEFYKNI
jgi:DNA-binding LytR/AlgR family response regulator